MELDDRTLYEVLKRLHEDGFTGKLRVRNWAGQEGVIGLNDGLIVHCQVGRYRGMEALNVVKDWVTVSMDLSPDPENIPVNIDEDTEAILASFRERDEEIKLFRQFIPNVDAVFELWPDGPGANVSLSPRTWKFLAFVNGRNSVKDICRSLEASEYAVMKALYLLAKGRVIRLVALEEILPATLREGFLKKMEETMAQYIGPIASIVIDDVFREMDKRPEHLTRNDLPTLVERASQNIDDERDRLSFQEEMLSFLRQLLKGEG